MKTNLKKLLPLAGVVSVFSSSLLLAASYGGSGDPCCPPRKPEPVCDPCNEEVTRMKVFEECKYLEITPNAGPRVACGTDVFITADFIYWATSMDGLAYSAANVGSGVTSEGTISTLDTDWSPGFKVGLGYNLPHDGWDIFAEYTYLRPSQSNSVTSASGQRIPMWSGPNGFGGIDLNAISFASADVCLDLNVLDVELGRNYFISRYLTLRPFFGVKAAWVDTDFDILTQELNNPLAGGFTNLSIDHWGVGLRTGMDTLWAFNQYFGIFGDFALSALWGNYDISRRDGGVTFTNDTDRVIATSTNGIWGSSCFSSMKSVFEIAMGFEADVWFSDDQFHFGVKAGWEMQYWPNQNQFFSIFEEGSHGDLGFMGLTLQFRFDF